MIRDLLLFMHSVANANGIDPSKFYWETAEPAELNTLVERLSNTEDNERRLIREILHRKKPRTVLDVACGPATELTGYIKDGIDVYYTGLDLSLRMLEIARSRNINGHFVMGDALKMPFSNNTFDIVLLKHLLEHLPEYHKAVIEALRVAEGQVIINFFHKLLPVPFDITLFDRRGFYNNWYSRSRFEEFLKSIGVAYQMYSTLGYVKQTAEVYILERR